MNVYRDAYRRDEYAGLTGFDIVPDERNDVMTQALTDWPDDWVAVPHRSGLWHWRRYPIPQLIQRRRRQG